MDYRSRSLWLDQVAELGDSLQPRPPARGRISCDVVVVGAGYTGLWTARYLSDAGLDVVVVDRNIAGFGASGRNGGWCSALFPRSPQSLTAQFGRPAALAMVAAMEGAIDEVQAAAALDGIDCDFVKGGCIMAARTPVQWQRAQHDVAELRDLGLGPDHIDLLTAEQARERVGMSDMYGATYTPHCAALHPAKLVRGLARSVEGRGVRIFERSPALSLEPGRVRTPLAEIRAGTVVRATEAFTSQMRGMSRHIIPVYSLVIAIEPLPDSFWEGAGLDGRATFADMRGLIIYGQRTADGRLVFGGRGAPYHVGSSMRSGFDRDDRVFAGLRETLQDLFPELGDVRVTHRWGGAVGATRDWMASCGLDRAQGIAWAGGYLGDGVSTSNLAGRTLRDLILGRDTELTQLPWVNHRSPKWEPEPLRWAGVNAGRMAVTWSDRVEATRGRPSRLGALARRLTGH